MAFPLLVAEPFWQSLLPANASFSRSNFCKREIQTKTQPTSHANEDLENHEMGTLKPDCDSVNAPSNINSISFGTVSEYSATSNLKTSPRHNLAMIFTCNVCETRSVKTVCRESYEKGVVVARCGGCNNLHLMADHLGWFGRPGSVEEFLAARGEEVKKGSIDTLNLTPDDLAGWKS
jgi:protein import protein ZIM17